MFTTLPEQIDARGRSRPRSLRRAMPVFHWSRAAFVSSAVTPCRQPIGSAPRRHRSARRLYGARRVAERMSGFKAFRQRRSQFSRTASRTLAAAPSPSRATTLTATASSQWSPTVPNPCLTLPSDGSAGGRLANSRTIRGSSASISPQGTPRR
jgi:hypothetical protein